MDLKKIFNLKKERKKEKKPFFSWSSEQAFQDLPQLGSESSWGLAGKIPLPILRQALLKRAWQQPSRGQWPGKTQA